MCNVFFGGLVALCLTLTQAPMARASDSAELRGAFTVTLDPQY